MLWNSVSLGGSVYSPRLLPQGEKGTDKQWSNFAQQKCQLTSFSKINETRFLLSFLPFSLLVPSTKPSLSFPNNLRSVCGERTPQDNYWEVIKLYHTAYNNKGYYSWSFRCIQDYTLTGIIRNLPEKQNGSPSFGKLSSGSIKNTDLSVKSLLTEWTGKSFCKKFPYPQSTESKRKNAVWVCACAWVCAHTQEDCHSKSTIYKLISYYYQKKIWLLGVQSTPQPPFLLEVTETIVFLADLTS